MYKDNSQLRIEDFPYGKLDPGNDWVKLAALVPWDVAAILEVSVPKAETAKQDDSDDGNDPPNSGTLVLDATCCPADIAYPQDIDLLNQAREKAEETADELCEAAGQKRPRMWVTLLKWFKKAQNYSQSRQTD